MSAKTIRLRGVRTHNLKDLDLDLPREALTVVCGVSGSGKSSLVLDTLGAESRRRFLGTLGRPQQEGAPHPDVDRIDGLPPAVEAGFTARGPGPRHTLATVTDIAHALRALWARVGIPHCPDCDEPVAARTREAVTAMLLALPQGARVVLTAARGRGPEAVADAVRDGFVRVRVGGGAVRRVEDVDPEGVAADARIEVVVDRLVVKAGAAERFAASVDQGLEIGGGVLFALVTTPDGEAQESTFAARPYCASCGTTWPRLTPALFSFNGPTGACTACEGRGTTPRLDEERVLPRRMRLGRLGNHLDRRLRASDRPAFHRALAAAIRRAGLTPDRRTSELPPAERERLLRSSPRAKGKGLLTLLERGARGLTLSRETTCRACDGTRLQPFPRAATVGGLALPDAEALTTADLLAWLEALPLPGPEGVLAEPARLDAVARLRFLRELGLAYLAPARAADTLSGGELRRARLAAACAARMSGLLFLLDEPTAGLHPADREDLRSLLRRVVDEGNTVVCVEHDVPSIRAADHLVELGPGAGAAGGRVLYEGPPEEILAADDSPLGNLLRQAPLPPRRVARSAGGLLRVRGASVHNLRDVDASFPLRGFTCLTGVSGAGKSTLLLEVLAPAARALLDRAPFPQERCRALEGLETIDRVSVARGAPPRHPRATPASVLGVLTPLRRLFAATLEARARGWGPSRFSRQVRGGRCEVCVGRGDRRVGLRDLPPIGVPCETCDGTGFARDTRQVRVKGLSIADVLGLTLAGAATLFRDIPTIARPLLAATDVGLGYVPLGEPTSRLSGGEALRLRLAAALGRGGETPTLYLLDEPSAGLHPADVAHLAEVLLRLGEAGSTVVAVDHHLHLVRVADHVVELGPGAGPDGGRVLYAGPPAGILEVDGSPTGAALRA